jgi:outer membrane protein insertion porin family
MNVANLTRSGITSAGQALLSYDSRDNRMFPTRGWYNTISGEVADTFLLSQNIFTRYEAVARYFYPIWGPFVFRAKLEGGMITSRDPLGVPIFERYFVGGIYDIRGFRPRTLGPRIQSLSSSDPNAGLFSTTIGGNAEVIINSEIEFPIFEKVGISGVVFVDAGNAFNTESRYCPSSAQPGNPKSDPCVGASRFPGASNLRYSTGFGFRWFSPIGPLRFEWGIPLDKQPGEENIVFEFTIGNFF